MELIGIWLLGTTFLCVLATAHFGQRSANELRRIRELMEDRVAR